MKMIFGLVLFGTVLARSVVSFAGDVVASGKMIALAEIRVWDCDCLYFGRDCYEEHERKAEQLRLAMVQISAVNWALGSISRSEQGGETGSAVFEIGVHEGSMTPSLQQIIDIGSETVKCGELLVRHRFERE